ncbi:MAG: hypothetical protein HY716_06720 [Planctomycetes bacterium]|nr:hypothetical protein [Planctomycetota bacterium]
MYVRSFAWRSLALIVLLALIPACWHEGGGGFKRAPVGPFWRPADPITADNAGNAFNPEVAVDSDGNATAVWTSFDGVRSKLWSNRYTLGEGWGAAVLIETNVNGGALTPQVVADFKGSVTVVWQQADGFRARLWSVRYE